MNTPVRVLVVEDSPLFRRAITSLLSLDPDIQVVGTAVDGREAIDLVSKLRPDVITMDIHLPTMDSLEATRQIMAYHPTPILILSSSTTKEGQGTIFQALEYGALDVFPKVTLEISKDPQSLGRELAARIKMLARVRVVTHPLAKFQRIHKDKPTLSRDLDRRRILAIGASTGGPQALRTIFRSLPSGLPCSVLVVQHIAAGFAEGLAGWLDEESDMEVVLATNGVSLRPGVAYVAPTQLQMRAGRAGILCLTDEDPCEGHKPSASILFESVADVYGEGAVGVILSGMGKDGTRGLRQLKAASGIVLAQDEATSVIFGMPKAAIEAGVVDEVLPIEQMAEAISRVVNSDLSVKV